MNRPQVSQALFTEFTSVVEAKTDAVRGGHWEEASLLRERELVRC